MTSVIRKEPATESRQKAQDSSSTTSDVQSYLISNYREALKKGDRSAAKSCLLAARYFSVNDPNVTNEIYLMAKSDGDVGEASKCFANMFSDIFLDNERDLGSDDISSELKSVIHQIKDEMRSLLTDLKSQYLRFKSLPAPAALASRQTSSIQTSPMLSPRIRMSSEDRTAARDSMAKLDSHLHSSSRTLFYQQLFESLPDTIKKSMLDHSIETCETSIEQCRLMMLAMSIFNENVNTYGGRLLRSLVKLSSGKAQQEDTKVLFSNPLSSMMQQYAKSLLVLDAIPLVLNLAPLSALDINIEELYEATLNYYSMNCLETSASEFEANELHEGVKKSIATRILGIEHNSAHDEAMEEHVIMTMNLVSQKFIETLPDDEDKARIEKLHLLIKDKQNLNQKFDQILSLIHESSLDDDIPDNILFASSKDDGRNSSQPVSSTPPPKGRGRPKKQTQQTVIVTPDDVIKKQLQSKSRELQFAFFSILQHMFVNCANYLKRTRSRIFMNFSCPLLAHLQQELAKSSSSRSSRSKAGSQPITSEISASPAKRPRLDNDPSDPLDKETKADTSPLNSEQSRIVDSRLLQTLIEAHKSLEFLSSNFGSFTRLWTRFLETTTICDLKWYRRISVDSMLLSGKFEKIPNFLEVSTEKGSDEDVEIKTEQSESGTSTLTINPSCRQASVSDLRDLVQLVSCYVQLADKGKTLARMNELVARMKQCGLLTNDDSYSNGNIIQEYMIVVKQDDKSKLGFLFFDTLSLLRYIVNILMDILKKYIAVVNLTTDAAIGHTIVLSQFDWPKEASVCSQCISWLRIQKPKSTTPQCLSSATKFTYPDFFQYILNPNIIEDFMAMLCHGYTLDIKSNSATGFLAPSSSQARDKSSGSGSSQRGSSGGTTSRSKAITTRGVNKTFKEDLKVALTSQMRNSVVLVPLDLISDFIQNSLIPFFNG